MRQDFVLEFGPRAQSLAVLIYSGPRHALVHGSRNLGACVHGSRSLLLAPSMTDYVDALPPDEEYFPLFSFSEVTLGEVQSAIKYSTSQARGHYGVPQCVNLLLYPFWVQ